MLDFNLLERVSLLRVSFEVNESVQSKLSKRVFCKVSETSCSFGHYILDIALLHNNWNLKILLKFVKDCEN